MKMIVRQRDLNALRFRKAPNFTILLLSPHTFVRNTANWKYDLVERVEQDEEEEGEEDVLAVLSDKHACFGGLVGVHFWRIWVIESR